VIEADVHDQQELIRHFRGMDAVINLVGILHESRVGRVDLPSARRGDFQKVHIDCRARSSMPAANPACTACFT